MRILEFKSPYDNLPIGRVTLSEQDVDQINSISKKVIADYPRAMTYAHHRIVTDSDRYKCMHLSITSCSVAMVAKHKDSGLIMKSKFKKIPSPKKSLN